MIPTYSQTATCEYTIIVVFLMQAYPQHKQVLGFQGQGLLILYLEQGGLQKDLAFHVLSPALCSHRYSQMGAE